MPSPSRFTWFRAAAAALALCSFAAAGPACLACNDIACGGSLEWSARTEDAVGLLPGSYAFDITLESSSYTVECTVADTVGESECGEPTKVMGEVDFDVMLDVSHLDPNEWNPEGPAGGFYLDAADHTDDGVASSTRGPTDVRIVVTHDGQPLLDESYEVAYQRDEAFRGNERCGFCDDLESRETTFTQ
jgi:hypothetical protein